VWQNGRAALGDVIYRYITSDQFSQDCLLDCLDLSSEYQALEIANRVEASIYVWRRKGGGGARSSWGIVKDMVMDTEKRDLLAERAEALLMSLKQRFPGLTQTSLDMSKIQYNKVQFAIHRDESSFVHRCLGRTSEHFLFFFSFVMLMRGLFRTWANRSSRATRGSWRAWPPTSSRGSTTCSTSTS
jgi:hypothetical protein